MQNHRFIHFPMNSNGKNKDATPFHWTLLLLDRKQGQWMHYNSMRPRKKNAIDHYFKDADCWYMSFTITFFKSWLTQVKIYVANKNDVITETVCRKLQLRQHRGNTTI